MRLLKLIVALLVSLMLFIGCSGKTNIGDGKIDTVEEAEIRIAVGLILSSRPETVPMAYLVSEKLLQIMSDDYISTLDAVDIIVAREVKQIKFTPEETASFNDLLILVKAKISEQVNTTTVDGARLIMVKQVIKIVNESSKARMKIK